jgi:hypothetical protein
VPLRLDPAGWYLGAVLLGLIFVAAPALWGFWTSRAGRPLFRDEILGVGGATRLPSSNR